MNTPKSIRIHRHAGNTALSFEGVDRTIYLDHEQSAWLARKLRDLVIDVEHRSFERSTFETQEHPGKRECELPPAPCPHGSVPGTGNLIQRAIDAVAGTKQFTVVVVSSNTNSFGYKSVLCLAEDGEGFEGLVQAYGCEAVPVRGDLVDHRDPRFYGLPRVLPRVLPAQAAKVLKEVRKGVKL